jgi:hypothetical protein
LDKTSDNSADKLEDNLQKLVTLQEQSLSQQREDMVTIKHWMESLQQDRTEMVQLIKEMTQVLSSNLPKKSCHCCPQSGPTLNNCNCQYAGIYFVHN